MKTLKRLTKPMNGLAFLLILLIWSGASTVFALPIFSFDVYHLEAYDRSGNWTYDADSPGFPTHDGDWFTKSPSPSYMFHYFAEKYIHQGTPTVIECVDVNLPFTDDASEVVMHFDPFSLVSFKRINTVDPLMPWDTPGQSGDERVYVSNGGHITHNGIPVLYLQKAKFVITTPYPNQAQVRALNPIFSYWTGDIGTGAPQTGYGFGDLDETLSDPAWLALFADSGYKVEMQLVDIVSTVTPSVGYFDFLFNILPATVPYSGGEVEVDLDDLPGEIAVPETKATIEVIEGTPGGLADDMKTLYLSEIGTPPTGNMPAGLAYTTNKHWELGGTLETFNVNIRFGLDSADFAKGPMDWQIIYRRYPVLDWEIWPNQALSGNDTIVAYNVTDFYFFAVASPYKETVPVVLSSMSAYVNSDHMAVLKWSTASESDMNGFKVYANDTIQLANALILTPVVIPAHNTTDGADYSFTANELEGPATYYFWLEAISIDGHSTFYGPVSVILTSEEPVPPLPDRSILGTAYPNPFKTGSRTNINAEIKQNETGTLEIYNITGQKVKSYTLPAGIHLIDWDGRDASGRNVASGIYYYKLTTPSYTLSRKLVVVK
ncbi:MAG: T9SS type A sorting domain-containing protein [Candidatus Cloacimonadaceae bacterium]